jgi:exodeoxyribonuclease VII small subunit
MTEQTDLTEGSGGGGDAPKSYEAAVARLETIISRLDSGKAELRETLDLCREGKVLVEYCKGELDAVSGELQRLDLDELVRKLESGAAAGGPESGPTAAGSVDAT